MRLRDACAIVFFLISAVSVLARETGWKLPPNMEWREDLKLCIVSGSNRPLLKGCYFGFRNSAENTGLAFFRVCGQERETFPFLVVYFDREAFTLDLDVDGRYVRERPVSDSEYGPIDIDAIDPVPFYGMVNDRLGSCFVSRKPNVF